MKDIEILFGTESGNAESAAEDMAKSIKSTDVKVTDMTDFDVSTITNEKFYIVICSTHGEGDVPGGAIPFFETLKNELPDLTGIEYAMFGLGDKSYENYSRGSEHIDIKLRELGAERIGEYGRHDASTGTLPNDYAVAWIKKLISEI